jgi:serine/threonine protein kinase
METASTPSEAHPPALTVSLPDGRVGMTLTEDPAVDPGELRSRYHSILAAPKLDWTEHHRLIRRLGSGGQGVVFLGERRGTDGFRLPVALKIFSPGAYENDEAYEVAMSRMADVAARVAAIQQDNLLDVHNFVAPDGVRVMEMEWIDGYDLQRLLTPGMLHRVRDRVGEARWTYLNDVIVTAGTLQPRLKPGIAIAVLRDCLAALSALHRDGIVHGDVKPSNIMLKRTGNAKLIDIGAAFRTDDVPERSTCTPAYAAPEVLAGAPGSVRSDLAGLGYVLIEMLSGASPFHGLTRIGEMRDAKQSLVGRLWEILPEEVVRNELLMSLISGLIAPDPDHRFPDAQAADLVELGAANFQRQLVKGDLASEYVNEIRVWLEELENDDGPDRSGNAA